LYGKSLVVIHMVHAVYTRLHRFPRGARSLGKTKNQSWLLRVRLLGISVEGYISTGKHNSAWRFLRQNQVLLQTLDQWRHVKSLTIAFSIRTAFSIANELALLRAYKRI